MKLDRNLIVGASALIITVICGIFSLDGGIGTVLLTSFFFIAAVAGIIALHSFFLPQAIGVGANWFCYVPFPVMLIVSRMLLGWDLFMPFCVAGFLAITIDMYSRRPGKNNNETLFIAGSGAASVLVFAIISLCGGIVL